MKKIAFVIPCKNTKKVSLFIQNCVESILANYCGHDIHIVDSDSEDRQTIRDMVSKNKGRLHYHEINNKNYSTGALWYIFDKYENEYEYYFLIHDSTTTVEAVENLGTVKVAPVMYSYDWLWPRVKNPLPERSDKFAKDKFAQNNLTFPPKWPLVLGPMFLAKSSVLQKIKKSGFYNIRPNNKYESECMERLWGAIFTEMGYEEELVKNSISGKTDDDIGRTSTTINGVQVKIKKYTNKDKIIKYWIKRK